MIDTRSRAAAAICVALYGPPLFVGVARAADVQIEADPYPIIAQIFSEPSRFATGRVSIYGIVTEVLSPTEFVLQDVSQRPLRVTLSSPRRVREGDQIAIAGAVAVRAGEPLFMANILVPTRVLGGGGCC